MGIDPGKSGGICILDDENIYTLSMTNKTEMDIYEWILEQPRPNKCYFEKVASMPRDGNASAFTFGKAFGFIYGILTAMQIPFEMVRPLTWQKALSCQTKGVKNVTKRKALQLFPQIKITHAIADAMLIAEYGKRYG